MDVLPFGWVACSSSRLGADKRIVVLADNAVVRAGSFNAETGGTPSVSTSWYDKATSSPYIFRHPTIFGAGERHDELMYGRENLLRDIREAASGETNVYVTVNGAENPEDWALRFAKEFKLQARTA